MEYYFTDGIVVFDGHVHERLARKRADYVLFDINILVDQTKKQDFQPFKKFMTKVQGGEIDSAYEVYLTLYHQLVGNSDWYDCHTKS